MGGAVLAEPLTVQSSNDANVRIGERLSAIRTIKVQRYGAVALNFPFDAGTYRIYGCTESRLTRSRIVNGGLQVTIQSKQLFFCFKPQYRVTFNYRKPTNPNTEYQIGSSGQIAIIKGTAGGTTGKDGKAYFQLSEGESEIVASNGDRANLVPGKLAIASDKGVLITEVPKLDFDFERFSRSHGKIKTHPSIRLKVDGKDVNSGQTVWNPRSIELEGLDGKSKKIKFKSWLYF